MALAGHILHAFVQAGIAQTDGGIAAEEQLVDLFALLQACQCAVLPQNGGSITGGAQQPLMACLQSPVAQIQTLVKDLPELFKVAAGAQGNVHQIDGDHALIEAAVVLGLAGLGVYIGGQEAAAAHAGVAVALAILVHLEFQHLLFRDIVRHHTLGGALGGQLGQVVVGSAGADVVLLQNIDQLGEGGGDPHACLVLHALIALPDGLFNNDGKVGLFLRVAGLAQIHEYSNKGCLTVGGHQGDHLILDGLHAAVDLVAPVSLYILCEDVKNTYSFRCQPGVELVFEESDPSLVISTDRNRLFQVFSNLIGNATKFTAKGSISFGYKLKEKEIVFHVADTGSGISDDKIDKIFDRFIMANNQVQGTGLGLSISKIIVEKLGGKIAVQSKMGTGTTFTFTLPYISANGDMKWEEKLTPASIKDNNRTSHQEMTILVAEDYQSNYDLIEAMLGKMYKLVHAHDGMEAIIFYEQYKPDLILMDIKMPNINGLDATKAIREMSASVPVIAVSAYAYEKDKTAAIESGCNEFLTKPVSADLLKMTINKYLKQK